MLYVSTRGKTDMVSSAHAISSGLAKDGGLFVPRDFPPVALAEIDAMTVSYTHLTLPTILLV